jgi:uncharacterized protein (TIGR00645 family)
MTEEKMQPEAEPKQFPKIEEIIETVLFQSRWILAPLYLGLVGALLILVTKFMLKFVKLALSTFSAEGMELVLGVLGLVDIVLISNLLLIIIFSGYENFVSKIDAVKGHVDRPDWMGTIDYSGLKLKVIGSIVAISAIELLKAFLNVDHMDHTDMMWLVIIHLTFVLSGIGFALMEKIHHGGHAATHSADEEHEEEQKIEEEPQVEVAPKVQVAAH